MAEVQPADILFGRPGGKLCLRRADPGAMVQLGFWPDTADAVHAKINAVTGLTKPLEPGRFARVGAAQVLRSAFDTYLVIGGDDAVTIDLAPDQCAITDLSDARRGVAIEGPASESFLNRDIAVNLSLSACPVGSGLQTAMHHVSVLLLRTDETGFVLFAYRSYMDDLIGWMLDMALPFEG